MPSIYQAKTKFQNLLRPCVRVLYKFGVTANAVTLAAMLTSIALGGHLWCVLSHQPEVTFGSLVYFNLLLLPLWMFLRMALNAIDGMLAREFNQASSLGAILNEVGDIVSDVALYAPFILLSAQYEHWLIGVIFLAILTEFVGVLAQSVGGVRRYDGPMGKSDRACVFGALAVFYPYLANGTHYIYAVLSVLLLMTIIKRTKGSINDAKQNM